MNVVTATKAEIEGYPEKVRTSALAATAETLAVRLNESTPRDAASIGRELRAALTELREKASATPEEASEYDRIRARRAGKCPTCGADASNGTSSRKP